MTVLIKDKSYIALTFMTGILPIDYFDKISDLYYAFKHFTMISPKWMAKYIGFTDEEVKMLCKKYINFKKLNNSNKNQVVNNKNNNKKVKVNYKNIRKWYNGYQLIGSKNGRKYEIYTPFSIIKSLNNNHIEIYWNKSETFPLLSEYINMDFFGLKEDILCLIDDRKKELKLNYRDDVLIHLVHLGYLAFKSEKRIVYIPNKEVHEIFEIFTRNEE